MDQRQPLDDGYAKEYDHLDSKAIACFSSMVKSTRYIVFGIVVFILMLAILMINSLIRDGDTEALGGFLGVIMFFPIFFGHPFYFLFFFSKKMGYALDNYDGNSMTEALANLRSFFNTVLCYFYLYLFVFTVTVIADLLNYL